MVTRQDFLRKQGIIRKDERTLFLKFISALLMFASLFVGPAKVYAQSNAQEETERRAKTLKNLPANAAKRFFWRAKRGSACFAVPSGAFDWLLCERVSGRCQGSHH
jgi:hypothetical protein